MMQTIGCDLKREGGRIVGTTVLALLAGFITCAADGDAFSLSLGTGLLLLTVILIVVGIIRLYQQSLFSEEAHFLMTLPIAGKSLLRGKFAVAVMWMSMAEIVYCSPLLVVLLCKEPNWFEEEQMQSIIYWMMERGGSQGDISVLAALLVPLILFADGLFCSLVLYLCFLKNSGKKKGAVLFTSAVVTVSASLGIVFAEQLGMGIFPFGMVYTMAAGGAVLTVLLFRRCTELLEKAHDVA